MVIEDESENGESKFGICRRISYDLWLDNVGLVTADTCYCHHVAEDGRHCVLNNLPARTARKCKGILFFSLGLSGNSLQCGAARGIPYVSAGHDSCNKETCPFMQESGACPYMMLLQ